MTLEYSIGDELGDAGLFHEQSPGVLRNFLSGWTFSLVILDGAGESWFSAKTSGITGAAGDLTTDPPTPNIVVAWATSGELNSITTPGTYALRCTCTRTADGKTVVSRHTIRILPA